MNVQTMVFVQGIAGGVIPLLLFLVLWKKFGMKRLPFLVGALTWMIFVSILESLVHSLVLVISPAGAVIQKNLLLYALYGGLMAALFEETGRFFAFKLILKDHSDDKSGIMYGAGHGSMECITVLFIGAINNLVVLAMAESGYLEELRTTADAATIAQYEAVVDQLQNATFAQFLMGILERMSAIIAHIGLSIIVWFSVKENVGKKWLLGVAMGLHFALDFVTVLLQDKLDIAVLEILILVLSIGIAFIGLQVFKQNHVEAVQKKDEKKFPDFRNLGT